jgi:hypothetical protein
MIFGLGSALGGFIGGPTYEAIGFERLFTILGWVTLGALAVFVAARMTGLARRHNLPAQHLLWVKGRIKK